MVDFKKLLEDRRAQKERPRGLRTLSFEQERQEDLCDARQDAEMRVEATKAGLLPHGLPPLMPVGMIPTGETITGTYVADDDPETAAWKREPFNALMGAAGVGKTFFVKGWAKQEKPAATVLAATTGIAAINLGEGTTINALLGFFDTNSLKERYVSGGLTSRLWKLYKSGLRRIFLDEVSMLDAEHLTLLVKALDEVAGKGYDLTRGYEPDGEGETAPNHPSGYPISLTLTGDFCQLPPVKADFAFQSEEWARFAPHVKLLTEIRRQNEQAYIEALMAIRRGDPEPAIAYFGPRMHDTTDQAFDGTTIFATNDEVGRFNLMRMAELKTPRVSFTVEKWGDQSTEWGKNIPDPLILKEGALVMILANAKDPMSADPNRFLYVNGDLGELLSADANTAIVRLKRTGQEVVVPKITRQKKIPLEPGRMKALKAEGHADRVEGKWEITGAITYMPLRLAYATTVHKSQGLSLDQVQVNIRHGFFASGGMLYVALSRARTAEGLRLVGQPGTLRARVAVNPAVRAWL
jgi:ATP-dependent DNA helicase PIF1